MNWNEALSTSILWVLKAYGITLVLFVASGWFLVTTTQWGRQFWRLTGAYFAPRRSWRPLLGLALILFLTLCAVRVDVLFSDWYNSMYTALQQLDAKAFWFCIGVFSVLAAVHIVRALLGFYVKQSFAIYWRAWLNEKLLADWLGNQAYYRSLHLAEVTDNPDQRIQQDVESFVDLSLSLSMGVVNAIVSTIAYTLILWQLSGVLAIFGIEIPRGMVFAVYLYVIVVTFFAVRIGRPLISLNFLNQKLGADYRYALIRLREYAENIAFYAGEKVEGALLRYRFGGVIANAWKIVFRSLKFQGFNFIANQTAVIFPFIIQAGRFFSKQITLGDLMQTAQAFGSLQDNLSFFRSAYDEFAGYRATLTRLSGFLDVIDQAHELPKPQIRAEGERVALEDLTVRTPDGRLLADALSFALCPGDAMLIRGPSGVGKTTLLRTVAGIWPYCTGQIVRPDARVIFLSQRPYMPQGSLREALYYPALEMDASAERLSQILAAVQLGHLEARLDEVADWGRILSLGEQQRLAFGRLLLARPIVAFLDEATSAMDEGLEYAMYSLLRAQIPECILVSVGHRSTLQKHHSLLLDLPGEGKWSLASASA